MSIFMTCPRRNFLTFPILSVFSFNKKSSFELADELYRLFWKRLKRNSIGDKFWVKALDDEKKEQVRWDLEKQKATRLIIANYKDEKRMFAVLYHLHSEKGSASVVYAISVDEKVYSEQVLIKVCRILLDKFRADSIELVDMLETPKPKSFLDLEDSRGNGK
jgi:hypothetical protein